MNELVGPKFVATAKRGFNVPGRRRDDQADGGQRPRGASFDRREAQCESRFFAAGIIGVQHTGFGRLVEGRSDRAQGRRGFVFLSRRHQREKFFLQRLEARLDALIVEMPVGAVAHAVFGGLGIRHKINCCCNFSGEP